MHGSRNFCRDKGGGGGGGVQVQLPENSSDVFLCFLVLNLFYSFTEGVQWLFKRKTIIFGGFRGGPTFSRGGGGGVQMLVSIETVYPPSESMHDIQVGVCTH